MPELPLKFLNLHHIKDVWKVDWTSLGIDWVAFVVD